MPIRMKMFWLLMAGCIAGWAAPPQLDDRGRLRIDELTFRVDCLLDKQNYSQGTKYFKAGKVEKDASGSKIRSEVFLPEQAPGVLNTVLKSAGAEDYEYESVLEFSAPVKLRGISLRANLPVNIFSGRELEIDGKKFTLPLEFEKVHFFRGKCQKLLIPGSDGMLSLSGDLSLQLHDYRPGQNYFSLIIAFSPGWGDITNSSCRLNIRRTPYRSVPIDLRKAANSGFADPVEGDGKGGWSDQGPDNDLQMIPVGRQRWGGMDFDIIDPAENGGRSCIMLAGKNREYFAGEAGCNIDGNMQGKYLYVVHALAWPGGAAEVGEITVTYQDNTSTTFAVLKNREAGNWWSPSPRANGEVAWIGENRSSYVGLFRSVFAMEDKPLKRIDFKSANNSVWGIVAASVTDHQVPKTQVPPYYIVAGNDWKPIDYHKDIEPGSVFDFSGRLDAPAGKYGPVIIQNGQFVFRDKPGQQARFYGTNLCSAAPYVDKEWAERLADRMAAFGYNAVRLHHHDGGMVLKGRHTTGLDPRKMDQLDYLVHCFKERGIYISSDLYVSRRLVKGEIPEYPGAVTNIAVYKALFWILDSVYENWQNYSRNYLNHVNPYTGLAIKDDPVLISLSLVNEGNIRSHWNADAFTSKLYQEKFEAWRKEKKLHSETTLERNQQFYSFLTELYNQRYAQMVKFVRELGVKCPLSDQNMGASQQLSLMRNQYDYVDNHSYWSHPQFAEKSWQLPSLLSNRSAISANASPQGRLFPTRIYGKPFAVTELDAAKPNSCRAESPALYGAYGALQGWDMLFQFAYSHGVDNYMRDDRTSGHFDIATDVVKALSQRIGVVLFRDGGVKTAEPAISVPVYDNPEQSDSEYPAEFRQLGLVTGVGTVVNPRTAPQNQIPGKEFYDPDNGFFRSVTGQLELNSKKGTFKVVSPTCETIILPAGLSDKGNFLKVANKVGWGVFSVISVDARPLLESNRILILHLTNTMASKTKFATPQMNRLESWGSTPFLAARGEAELSLSPVAGVNYKLYAVNTAGKRLGEIPMSNGTFKASVFSPYGSVMAYELVKE